MMKFMAGLAVLVIALGAGAASTATAAAATKYPTSFKKFYGLKTSAEVKGRIGSPKGKCVKQRKIRIFRKYKKGFRQTASGLTNSKGKFKVGLLGYVPPRLVLYLKVDKKKLNSGKTVCLPARSRSKTFVTV